jgi:serine/threonine protein kinase
MIPAPPVQFLDSPYAENGTLRDVLRRIWKRERNPNFGPTEMLKCIFGIAFIMMRLHELTCAHPDLTDQAILWDSQCRPLIMDLNVGSVLATALRRASRPPIISHSPIFQAPDLSSDPTDALPVISFALNVFSFALLIYTFFEELPPRRGNPRQWSPVTITRYSELQFWNRLWGISDDL